MAFTRPAFWVLALALALYVAESAALTATTYRAGVVEYMPKVAQKFNVTVDQAQRIMAYNADQYEKYIIEAKAQSVDILVFPEYGLYGPNFPTRAAAFPYLESIPNAGANPCTEHDFYPYLNITHKLSCMARKYQMVLAVDMGDVQFCTKWDYDCPKDRRYQFNTLVVFDTDGAILGKYHKTNLYFEPEFDVPVNQSPVMFEKFGVKFGMMICFDVMFAKPQIEAVKRLGVTDMIFSSWWVNTPPILTATQVQQGWSRSFDINMLASNAGFNERTSGSGLFSRGVALASFTNPTMTSQSRLLVADMPILRQRPGDANFAELENAVRIPREELFQSKPLTVHHKILRNWDVSTTVTDQVTIDGLTCTFSYQTGPTSKPPPLDPKQNISLILYAANGYLTPLFPAIACGVASCHTSDADACITLLQKPKQSLVANQTTFSYFSLKATYASDQDLTVYPVSAKDEGVLYSETELAYTKLSTTSFVLSTPNTLQASGKDVSLLHIGFLGRNLNKAM